MQLSAIHIYPIKSLAGIAMTQWPVVETGFYLDRHWMLVDDKGNFLSQRRLPKMAQIKTGLYPDQLRLSAPGMEDISFAIDQRTSRQLTTKVWADELLADRVSEPVDQWFSEFLQQPCHLVIFPEQQNRAVDPKYATPQDRVGFADAYPFLLIGTASLHDLNQRLQDPVGMDRFRPNLVIETDLPFIEDQWRKIQLGDISMRLPKACSRCTIPNVDQTIGIYSKGDPIKTLAGYRTFNKQVYFGQNLLHDQQGELKIGMRLTILETGQPQPFL